MGRLPYLLLGAFTCWCCSGVFGICPKDGCKNATFFSHYLDVRITSCEEVDIMHHALLAKVPCPPPWNISLVCDFRLCSNSTWADMEVILQRCFERYNTPASQRCAVMQTCNATYESDTCPQDPDIGANTEPPGCSTICVIVTCVVIAIILIILAVIIACIFRKRRRKLDIRRQKSMTAMYVNGDVQKRVNLTLHTQTGYKRSSSRISEPTTPLGVVPADDQALIKQQNGANEKIKKKLTNKKEHLCVENPTYYESDLPPSYVKCSDYR